MTDLGDAVLNARFPPSRRPTHFNSIPPAVVVNNPLDCIMTRYKLYAQ